MSTVIRTDLDVGKVVSGFKTIATAARSSGDDMRKAVEGSNQGWVKYAESTAKADKANRVSAEGLGFVTGTLGRLNPQLALVGEQTVKQLPTIMAWGSSLAKLGVIGGGISAIGGSVFKIAHSMGQVAKETITAESALGQFIALGNSVKKGSFIDRMVTGGLGAIGANRADIEDQMKGGPNWTYNEAASGNVGRKLIDSSNDRAAQRDKIDAATFGIDRINSTDDITNKIAAEKKRMEGLALLDLQKGKDEKLSVTPEEIEASEAKLAALADQYVVITERINHLHDAEAALATEESQRWMNELKSSKEASDQIEKLSKEFHYLYNTNQLDGAKEKELLAGINKLQAKRTELIADEKKKTEDLWEAKKLLREQERQAHKDRIEGIANQAVNAGEGAAGNQLLAEVDRLRGQQGMGDDKLKKKAQQQAREQLRGKMDQIDAAFQEEIDAAARDLQAGNINARESHQRVDTARQARGKARKAAVGERGDDEATAFLDLQNQSRQAVVDFAEKNGSINAKQAEVAKKTIDVLELKSRELEEMQTLFAQLDRQLNGMAKPGMNQRKNQR